MWPSAYKTETNMAIDMIKSKVDVATFKKMEQLFRNYFENKRFKKIDKNIQHQIFRPLELSTFRKEMHKIFSSDNNFSMMEKRLDLILDKIQY